MTQTMDCSQARLSLGVYVLGAIDPAERALVDSHLAGCRDCRDELAGLAGLSALLARVGTEEAIALAASDGPPAAEEENPAPPQELLGTVLDLAAARRRRRRWLEAGLGAAVALVIAAGVFAGLRATSAPAPVPQGQPALPYAGAVNGSWRTASGQSGGMAATVRYASLGWGTLLAAQVTGIPVGTTCQVWVVGSDGARLLVGSWIVDNDEGAVWYPASAAMSAVQVHKFVITVGRTRSITIAA